MKRSVSGVLMHFGYEIRDSISAHAQTVSLVVTRHRK